MLNLEQSQTKPKNNQWKERRKVHIQKSNRKVNEKREAIAFRYMLLYLTALDANAHKKCELKAENLGHCTHK